MADDAADVVVLGYGSDLRGDDAAGRRVADGVALLDLPGVMSRSVHQLAPEHAVELTGRRVAIFVDACRCDDAVGVRPLTSTQPPGPMTHVLSPATLLALAATVGDPPARALLVTVPARETGLGTELSAETAADVRHAIARVAALCRAASPTRR